MKRILIVEDTSDLGRLLVAAISTISPDLKAEVMPSAEEAFMEITRRQADLLVTDIRLPGMSGIELLTKVHTRFPNVKIIVMTGLSEPEYKSEALKAGADVFFAKPLEMGDFLDAVRKLVGMAPLAPVPAAAASAPGTAASAAAVEGPAAQIPDILAGLRQRLGATGAIMIDDRGRVMAQAGDLPTASFESDWSPALMAAVSAGANVARLVSEGSAEGVLALRGKQYDLVLAPVGTFALLLALPTGKKALRLPIAIEEALEAQKELQAVLAEMGLKTQPVTEPAPTRSGTRPLKPFPAPAPQAEPEPEPEVEPAALDELAALFEKPVGAPQVVDLDSFWDTAASKGTSAPLNPDVLSYEQAVKLGLAPGNGG